MTREEAKKIFEYFEERANTQEPCDDAISRDAAKKEINCWIGSGEYRYAMSERFLIDRINNLPSVTQKSETETWNGMHGQITAPKGTFKKIFEDAESEE